MMKTLEHIKKSTKLFIEQKPMGDKDLERLDTLVASLDEDGRISKADAIALTQPQSKNPIRGYENFISKVNTAIKELLDELEDDYLLEVFKNFSLSTVQDDLLILAKVPLELHSTIKPNDTYNENKFINSEGESTRDIKIFVSYASIDERDKNLFINHLKTELQERKIEIDLKLWEMKDIPIGISFDKVIREELEKCDYGFTLLSSAFTASDYILEVELALLLETEKLIPIGLVGDIPSLLENIQEVKGRKKQKQAQELKTRNIFTSRDNLFFDKCKTEQRQKEFVEDLIESLIHRKAYDEAQKKSFEFHTLPNKLNYGDTEFCPFKGKDIEIKTNVSALNASSQRSLSVDIQKDLFSWSKNREQAIYTLLGDFGMGKTFNLRIFASHLWKDYKGDKKSIFPFYIDLRDVATFIIKNDIKRIPFVNEIIEEILRKSNNQAFTPKEILQMHEEQKLILIFDGLDEKLTHYEQEEQDRFLNELMSVVNTQKEKLNKTVFSCRNHYFETAIKQNHFLLGQSRENQQSKDFIALDILPLSKEDVKYFLGKRLDEDEVNKLMRYIGEDKYLGSISSRPFMLTKIVELLPQLAKLKAENQKLNTASFYKALINDTLGRDEPKHSIKERDKKFILMHLSFYMYKESTQHLSIDELNIWFLDLLAKEKQLRHYNLDKSYKLEKDLRNSTLLVRFGDDDFGFSHSSIYEYFLSQYALDYWEEVAGRKELSTLSRQFLLDMAVNLKIREKEKFLPKLVNYINISISNEEYWVKFSLDLLSILDFKIVHLEIEDINLENYHFKNLKIEHFIIKNISCNHSHFINCSIEELIIKDTDLSDSYFEDTNFINIEEKECIWRDITLLNSDLNLNHEIEHDYKKIIKDKTFFKNLSFNINSSSVNSVSFSPNGEHIVSGSDDNILKLWNLKGECLATFERHYFAVSSVSFSPNGEHIISSSYDNTLKLWNLKGECLRTFEGDNWPVNSVSFSPNGEHIISGSSDKTLTLWNLKGECLATFEGDSGSINSVSFSPNGEHIISGSSDKTLKLWNIKGECLATFERHYFAVSSVSFSPNGEHIISSSFDSILKLWNLKGECLATFERNNWSVNSVSFSPNGEHIISGSDDKTLKLWNLKGECLATFKGHNDSVNSVSFSPDGLSVLSASDDGTIRLWDIETTKEIARYIHQDKEWYSFNFQNKTAKGTPMSWKLSTLTDANGDTFTIDKLKGFEVYGYDR